MIPNRKPHSYPIREPRRSFPGTVYVARNSQHDFFKVGTTLNLRGRGLDLKRVLGAHVVFSIDVDQRELLERELHRRLKRHRIIVRPYQLPGRAPIRPITRECYRAPLETITRLIRRIMRECKIAPVAPVTINEYLPPMAPPKTRTPTASTVRMRRLRARHNRDPKEGVTMPEASGNHNTSAPDGNHNTSNAGGNHNTSVTNGHATAPIRGPIEFSPDEITKLLAQGIIEAPTWQAINTAVWDLLERSWFPPSEPAP